ncbi:uncharacterized protein PgNI_00561 [Pyricularia grisea]|uniref:Uncharacterized protein n=1 Tax=Pyricularia grisea TaxID=148305 RepID=A0A6P8BHY1_PYRGI|nr:uncharacterized protein PgNI_00561 [Pyricularia grisea]TLD16237.1 hypothetical protein PgNI_00561 [Pyricularia grisea]
MLTTIWLCMAWSLGPIRLTNNTLPTSSATAQTLITRTVPHPAPTHSTDAKCPTVTRTATVCRHCTTPECAVISAMTRRCDCPWPPASVTVAWPCGADGKCAGVKGLGCTTSYRWARPTSVCPANLDPPNKPRPKPMRPDEGAGCTAPPEPTVTSPPTTATQPTVTSASCSTLVTVEEYPQSCSCVSDFCIRDSESRYSPMWLLQAEHRDCNQDPRLSYQLKLHTVLHGLSVHRDPAV